MANAARALLDDRVAAGGGARTAVVTPSARTSYADLLLHAAHAGAALRARGVGRGDRIAVILPDGVEWAAAVLGAIRIGAVAVPLNTRLPAERWAEMLADSGARAVVADAAAVAALVPLLPPRGRAALLGPADLGPRDHRTDAGSLPVAEPVAADDMALWLYTSGTTGPPRAAIHLHRDLLSGDGYASGVLGVTSEDRMFSTSKLFFAYALGNALLIPLAAGAQTFLHPSWAEPDVVAAVMAAFAPTLLFSVPTFYARLVRADLPADAFRCVRIAVSAGERLPAEVHAAWQRRFGVELLDGLGATETIFMVLSNRPGAVRAGCAGMPVPGTDARLVDADGRDVPDGVEGVLHVRTPSASPRYWNRAADSRRTFVDGWFRTGDVCVRDGDGFYQHRGREDDRFKVAGMWVSPADVEGVLLGHPGVLDVGVVGTPAAAGLVKAAAFVVPRDGAGERLIDELRGLADRALPPHQRPSEIVLVRELPRTATGKLQRFVLRGARGA